MATKAPRFAGCTYESPALPILPGAALSTDQNRRGSRRHLPDHRKDLLHRPQRFRPDSEYAPKTQVALQFVRFLQAPLVAYGAIEKRLEGPRLHRLLQVQNAFSSRTADSALSMLPNPVSAIAGVRLPRSFKVRSSSKPSMPGITRSATITSRRIQPAAPALLGLARDLYFKIAVSQNFGQSGALELVVVDDQYPARYRVKSRHGVSIVAVLP